MKRMHISLPDSDYELLERRCKKHNISKSSYIKLLIAEHENTVPAEIKYSSIISEINNVEILLHRLILSDKVSEHDKLLIYEKINQLKDGLLANLA